MFKNKKLMRISLLLVGLLLVAGSSAFVAQRVLAGSCFTDVADGSFWYSVTCWMKNQTISTGYADGTFRPDWTVSRGEMALFLQRSFSNNNRVAYLTTGPTQWEANAAYPSAYVNPFWGWTHLRSSAIGTVQFDLSPTVPSSLYNTQMYAVGVKICYDADPNAYITNFSIKHLYYHTGGWTEYNTASDTADKTGVGCSVLNFATPKDMWGTDQVTVLLDVTFNSTGSIMLMGTTTVVIRPSTYLAVLGLDETEAALLGRGEIAPVEFDPASGLLP